MDLDWRQSCTEAFRFSITSFDIKISWRVFLQLARVTDYSSNCHWLLKLVRVTCRFSKYTVSGNSFSRQQDSAAVLARVIGRSY